jgi:hypothetical protein
LHNHVIQRVRSFSPWSTEAPCGPLDEPRITKQPLDPEYWIKQAKNMFGAAKQFADLLKACRSVDALAEQSGSWLDNVYCCLEW